MNTKIISGLLTLIEGESGIIGYLFPILQYKDGTILTDTLYFPTDSERWPIAVKDLGTRQDIIPHSAIEMTVFSMLYKDKIFMQLLSTSQTLLNTSQTRWRSVPLSGIKYRQVIDHRELPLYVGINERIDTHIAERLRQ